MGGRKEEEDSLGLSSAGETSGREEGKEEEEEEEEEDTKKRKSHWERRRRQRPACIFGASRALFFFVNVDTRKFVADVDWQGRIENGPLSLGFDYFHGISASLDMHP